MNRRTVLRGAGAVAILPWLSDEGLLAFTRIQETQALPSLKALSTGQFATLETLVEAILPADDRSPGAREARVADYIDLLLSESEDDQKRQWLSGLQALDGLATERFGAAFARLDAMTLDTLLGELTKNEGEPKTPLEIFFKAAKDATIRGYYTSEIGIHKELRYLGNRITPRFVGCQTQDGKDCPHCGQKAVL
jgi:hypothetical protein